MQIAVFPAVFGLFAVGILLTIIVAVVALSVSRAGKTAVAVCLLAPLLLFGSICFFYLARRSADDTVQATLDSPPPRPLIPLDASASRPVGETSPSSSPATATSPERTAAPLTESAGELAAPARPADAAQQAAPIQAHTAGAARPPWMDQPTGYRDGVDRTIATAGPYATPQECNQRLNEAIREAVRNHVDRFMTLPAGVEIELPPAYIHGRIVQDEWLQQSEYAVGPMYNLHALLVFDSAVNQEIERCYRESHLSGRLAYTGAGAALLLGLIGTMFGYLKLDTLTRGYYTGRLRAAAAAAILALVTVAGLLAHGDIGF
jgi:hypothetical protein